MDALAIKSPLIPRSVSRRGISTSARWRRAVPSGSAAGVRAARRSGLRRHSRISCLSKEPPSQDFQAFAKPSRLLPVSQANFCTQWTLEQMLPHSKSDAPCFYLVQLCTSSEFGSDLEDANSAILLCLIDESGNSVLQRISAVSLEDSEQEKMSSSTQTHFKRGSVDTINFSGPEMSKIEAVWVSLESGSWRLDHVKLAVINMNQSQDAAVDTDKTPYRGLLYDFGVNNIALGDRKGTSITELRPKVVTELQINDRTRLIDMGISVQTSELKHGISKEEGMKEYADLKTSLLIYDLLLVCGGSVVLTISLSEKDALIFSIGGIIGFFYLLLLQKSVDGLSTSVSPAVDENSDNLVRVLRGLKGPLLRFILLLVISATIIQCGVGSVSAELTPQELLIGTIGFFTCKMAVFFAAFKPLGANIGGDN